MTEREERADAEERRAGSDDDKHHVTEDHDGDAAFDRERLRLGSPADAALTALLEAGPEAVDHLLKAAQELLLAAKAVVDAGERAVESHREATDAATHLRGEPDRDPRVRRIDLA